MSGGVVWEPGGHVGRPLPWGNRNEARLAGLDAGTGKIGNCGMDESELDETLIASSAAWVTMGRVAAVVSTRARTRPAAEELPDWLGRQAAAGRRAAGGDRAGRALELCGSGPRGERCWPGGCARSASSRATTWRCCWAAAARFAALVHACIRLDAVLVPLNWRLTPAEIGWQLADSGARVLLHDAARGAAAAAAAAGVPGLTRMLAEGPPVDGTPTLDGVAPAAVPPHPAIRLDRVHCVIYTSGTTGRPKGALLTYGNQWWSAIGSALNLGTQASDRWLACMPLFHIGGLSMLLKSVIYGVPVVIHPGFDPAAVNAAIAEEGITLISVVSNMLQRMLDAQGARPYPPTCGPCCSAAGRPRGRCWRPAPPGGCRWCKRTD